MKAHQARRLTVGFSSVPALNTAKSLWQRMARHICASSWVSCAAPVAVPSIIECSERPSRPQKAAASDLRDVRLTFSSGRLERFDSRSWSWRWRPGRKTSTETIVRKPMPQSAKPRGKGSLFCATHIT